MLRKKWTSAFGILLGDVFCSTLMEFKSDNCVSHKLGEHSHASVWI